MAICQAVGARLCNVAELADGCTAGTGCLFDFELVWGVPAPPPPPGCTGRNTFADKTSLQTAATEYNSNAAAATAKYGAIAGWCVSGVTDMSRLFHGMTNFNADISGWDTSGVTDMSGMFHVRCAPRAPPPDLQFRHAALDTPRSLPASRPAACAPDRVP